MYRRKEIQHRILKYIQEKKDSNFPDIKNTGGENKDLYWVTLKELSPAIDETEEDLKKYLFELLNRGYIKVERPDDDFIYTSIEKGEYAYYASDLLRERREDINKFWLTFTQYLFYTVAITSSIYAMLNTASKLCR